MGVNSTLNVNNIEKLYQNNTLKLYIYLARTPEIGQGLGRIVSYGARKPEQT